MQNASGRVISAGGQNFDKIYPGTSQKLAFTATTGRSAAVGSRTTIVRLCATQDVHLAFGTTAAPTTPTAVADGTGLFLKAGVVEYVGVVPGAKIAAIRDSADGNLFITEGM